MVCPPLDVLFVNAVQRLVPAMGEGEGLWDGVRAERESSYNNVLLYLCCNNVNKQEKTMSVSSLCLNDT